MDETFCGGARVPSRHCERSEAIQLSLCCALDCFARARNDAGARLRILAARLRPGYASNPALIENRGRRESRVRAAPAVSRAKRVEKRTRAYRFSGNSPAFPAQWFYGLCRALPGDRAFLSPSLAKIASRKLDAGVEASGPHDFAVRRASALVRSAASGHRIQPRVRDDRDTPLEWGGRRRDIR